MTGPSPEPPAPRTSRSLNLPVVLCGCLLVILLGLAILRFLVDTGVVTARWHRDGQAVAAEPATFRDEQGRLCRQPVLQRAVEPDYPDTLRLLGVQGEVVVAVTIDTTGAVIGASIHRAAVAPLDSLAIAAARRTRWLPATIDGVPTVATMGLPYLFSLAPPD